MNVVQSAIEAKTAFSALAIYRRTMTMMMSIVHRLTGTALYFGTLLLTWWLIAAAEGPKSYRLFKSCVGSPAGKFFLLCCTWALGRPAPFSPGISDRNFSLPTANLLARATLIGSAILTVLVWAVGIWMRGHFDERHGTPLSRVRGLGSAKTGTMDFWIQRLTAVANVPLALFLIASLVALMGADYATVRSYLSSPLATIPMLLLILSGTWHMRIGMQVILEDYIHNETLKIVSFALNNFISAAVAIAGVYAVLKIGIQS